MCALNALRTWHNSTIADHGILVKMEYSYNTHGVKVIVDSAFKLADESFLIQSSQQDTVDDTYGGCHEQGCNICETVVRTWCAHDTSTVPHIKDPVTYEEARECKVIMQLMLPLYNYQMSKVGVSHILNSFMSDTDSHYRCDITETSTSNNCI